MRLLAMLLVVVALGAGAGMVYLMYRTLDTNTVVLSASPQFEQSGEAGLCGEVDLQIGARSVGRWLLAMEAGQTMSGVVAVQGNESSDIGFRIWSPSNRLVLFEPRRTHRQEFEVGPTIRGEYRFEFDNRHSAFTGKQVKVSICLS